MALVNSPLLTEPSWFVSIKLTKFPRSSAVYSTPLLFNISAMTDKMFSTSLLSASPSASHSNVSKIASACCVSF
eukprot:CAMPEP_0115172326 /NCGR_PEP_ID=MMETSP0270-20121206/2756_1 /TAXON_ID=71861 /ORGANISM="Scrippsiella trochoidea, Strain CCMP3099" /LENGTH=73 /DNA_ID=CAMNT_0002585111 /DNA_START=240 /DNA_END=458 /DNA_ORIENTATION=+